jgi:hypothetical protein
MPRRGSAQLLLLFFRSRSRREWTLAAIAGVLVVGALLQAGGEFPLLTRTGLVQALRQSAWQQALTGQPEPSSWPWTDAAPATTGKVPRLGLSASVGKEGSSDKDYDATTERPHPAAGEDPLAPRTKLSEVGVGDRITVTTIDGSSRVYRVTRRGVVYPHLAESDSGLSDIDPTLVTCLPLDPLLASTLRLVIQTAKDGPPAPSEPRPEQKL